MRIEPMPLFAEISAEGWVLIVTAISIGLLQLLSMFRDYMRDRDEAAKAAEVAKAQRLRDEKADKLAMAQIELAIMSNEQQDDMAVGIGQAVHQGNSALLELKKERADADERLAEATGTEEAKIRATMSRKLYLQAVKEQGELEEQTKVAAEKRAAAKLKAAEKLQELGPHIGEAGEELAELKKIETNTGKMADAVEHNTEAMVENTEAAAERDKAR